MRIGILGSGQLGRMLALAGTPLGMEFSFYDEQQGAPCKHLGPITIGSFSDQSALLEFAKGCDVVTYEFENVPCAAAEHVARNVPVYPPPRALEVSQDRVTEKEYLNSIGIETPNFLPASDEESLRRAVHEIGIPCVVKTRRFGYDGKGQAVVRTENDLDSLWQSLGSVPLIVEEFLNFSRELSIIACRSLSGTMVTYPLIQNVHRSGILHTSTFPAPHITSELKAISVQIAEKLLRDLEYVGVVAIELFEVNGRLIANEIAPRVHNSGHVTIDAAHTSQFENHLRAISGLPLGRADVREDSIMYNVVGSLPPLHDLAGIREAHIHLYGKEPRSGRKLGHVTIAHSAAEALCQFETLLKTPAT